MQQPYQTCRYCGQNAIMGLKFCQRCQRSLADAVQHGYMPTPNIPSSPPAPSISLPQRIIGITVFLIIMALFFFSDAPDKAKRFQYEAANVARDSIKNSLFAPATATFSDETTVLNANDSNRCLVWGFVETQNAFGVSIRKKWRCQTVRVKGQWITESTEIFDP